MIIGQSAYVNIVADEKACEADLNVSSKSGTLVRLDFTHIASKYLCKVRTVRITRNQP